MFHIRFFNRYMRIFKNNVSMNLINKTFFLALFYIIKMYICYKLYPHKFEYYAIGAIMT